MDNVDNSANNAGEGIGSGSREGGETDRAGCRPPGSWIDSLKFSGEDRLIPAIIQDATSLKVLMLGYMNREALEKTIQTGRTWFWSRSRRRLWQKGETSGHYQFVREVFFDCDSDSLLVKVDQVGGACHDGYDSCFYRRVVPGRAGVGAGVGTAAGDEDVEITGQKVFEPAGGAPAAGIGILKEICNVIDERRANPTPDSYTARLFQRGHDVILKKISEEAGEVIIASKNKEIGQIVYETADLLFHTLVMLRFHGIEFDDVLRELRRRRKPASEEVRSGVSR
ncbi:MAG TPA: bifunctional phosphoribosyl-AMP cyclohydrolase/phosphoribosyl-ATP diphosphatase HisIE [Firmicutes bacterium]|nr:bifunctional phosphoribosyl-AMP cyclohydrolase/phosphoribosyl-ATP diphosphatase HisIE [Bacillota bacterium]